MEKKSFSNEEECQYAIKAVNRQLNTHTHIAASAWLCAVKHALIFQQQRLWTFKRRRNDNASVQCVGV